MPADGGSQFVLLTDIGGSSRLWEAHPHVYPQLLEAHNQLTEALTEAHGGEILKNLGDGYLCIFERSLDALETAVGIQLALSSTGSDGNTVPSFPNGERLKIRAVVHGGPLQKLAAGRGWFGPALNRAARIAGVAHPGQTLISGFVRQRLSELAAEISLSDLGLVRLRDLSEPEQLFQVQHVRFEKHDFPPLLGMDFRPTNLMEQPGHFIGREAELTELRRLLLDEKQRLITLIAPGGYGKSRVANQLLANLLWHYEDGAWTVELAPLSDSARIAERAAAALGCSFSSTEPPSAQLVNYLRNKRILIHFDNFEHLADGAGLIADILQNAPGVQCVVTSRIALRLRGERIFDLEPLTTSSSRESAHVGGNRAATNGSPEGALAPAVELFVDRALQVNPRIEASNETLRHIQALVARLEGVPLAVEMAAAWSDLASPAELLEELGHQLDFTARMTDVPERQRSVRASCDWSWKLLSSEQQLALMRLSCFSGGFFYEAAGAVLGLKGMALRALLAGLLDKSWLYTRETQGKTRYSIRDAAAREYAEEKLTESEHAAEARQRYAAYFSEFAGREGPKLFGGRSPDSGEAQLAALRGWGADLENIYVALEYCLELRDPRLLMPFASFLGRYLTIMSLTYPRREKYEQILEAAREIEDERLVAAALGGLSAAVYTFSEFASSIELAEEGIEIVRTLGDLEELAKLLSFAGISRYMLGQYSEAADLLDKAVAASRASRSDHAVAQASFHRALVHYSACEFDLAAAKQAEALDLLTAQGNLISEAFVLQQVGRTLQAMGNYDGAKEKFCRVLELSKQAGISHLEKYASSAVAKIDALLGDSNLARTEFARCLSLCQERGDRHGEADFLSQIALLDIGDADFNAATNRCDRALELFRAVGDPWGIANCFCYLAQIDLAEGRIDHALGLLGQALAKHIEMGDKIGILMVCTWAGRALSLKGRLEAAAQAILGVQHWTEVLGCRLEPSDLYALDQGNDYLQAALEAGEIGVEQLERWRLQAAEMDFKELANSVLVQLAGLSDGQQDEIG